MIETKPHLLIDGDVFAYKASVVVEKIINFDGDNCFPLGSLTEAKEVFKNMLSDIFKAIPSSGYTIALSCDDTNFRKKVFPKYKANRIGKPRPIVLKFLKEWIEETYPCMKRSTLEGDDVIGILATSSVIIKAKRKIIVSIDKDMKTIPCEYYDIGKEQIFKTSYEEANRYHILQTLTGDVTDGYPGCPGVGIKTAEKILLNLTDYSSMWTAVIETYKKAGLDEEDALVQARLARILRNYDYDFKNKKPILWSVESEGKYK